MLSAVRVFVLGSGSTGNCLVLEAEGERVIIDAGIGPNRATARMRALGAELVTSRPPLGLFVSHDHGDHAAHAVPIARALRTPLYAHPGIQLERRAKRVEVVPFVPGRPVALGPFLIETLVIPHDALQIAVRVTAGGHRFGIATDLGHVTRELRGLLRGCDLVMLESNYCPELLETGPYPPRLKQRVAGPIGHLANGQAADLAASLEDTRVSRLVLAHLSRTNNTPDRALSTVTARLRRLPVEALLQGESRRLDVSDANGARRLAHGEQLGFAF
jgi:phosphoribosyl 1,2-cyclic phosphodiesterase